MKKKFEYQFEDESKNKKITFDFDSSGVSFKTEMQGNVPCIYGNRAAYMALAKIFVRLALCDYPLNFHLHLEKNFDSDQKDMLGIFLNE